MLYINDEVLDIRVKDDERVQFYLEELKKIRALKDYVEIEKVKVPAKLMKDDKGRLLREPFTTIPCKYPLNSVRGTELWRWAESRQTVGNKSGGSRFVYEPNHFILNDTMLLNPEKDHEKIFYLTRIIDVRTCGCRVVDPVGEAKKRNQESGGDELAARYMLFMSPEVTEEKIRIVARAWGLQEAEDCQIDILKDRLWNTVQTSAKRYNDGLRGYNNFVKDFQQDDRTEMRAVLNKAIHNGVIEYNAKESGYFYKHTGEAIIRVPVQQVAKKFELLYDYFVKNEELYSNLYIDMMGAKVPKSYSIADIDRLPDMAAVRLAGKEMRVSLPIKIEIDAAKQKLIDSLS